MMLAAKKKFDIFIGALSQLVVETSIVRTLDTGYRYASPNLEI